MAKRKVSEIETGMILLDDIFDEQDILLIGSGTELNMNHVEFLKRKNVQEVNVRIFGEDPVTTNEKKQIALETLSDVEEKYKSTVIRLDRKSVV